MKKTWKIRMKNKPQFNMTVHDAELMVTRLNDSKSMEDQALKARLINWLKECKMEMAKYLP